MLAVQSLCVSYLHDRPRLDCPVTGEACAEVHDPIGEIILQLETEYNILIGPFGARAHRIL